MSCLSRSQRLLSPQLRGRRKLGPRQPGLCKNCISVRRCNIFRLWCRQDDVQATAAQEEEVDEFESIEKLDQLGINRGAPRLRQALQRPH